MHTRLVAECLSLHYLQRNASLYVPVSAVPLVSNLSLRNVCLDVRTTWGCVAVVVSELCCMQPSIAYHTSAILACALDAFTLPYRTVDRLPQLSMDQYAVRLHRNSHRTLTASYLTVPFPA